MTVVLQYAVTVRKSAGLINVVLNKLLIRWGRRCHTVIVQERIHCTVQSSFLYLSPCYSLLTGMLSHAHTSCLAPRISELLYFILYLRLVNFANVVGCLNSFVLLL